CSSGLFSYTFFSRLILYLFILPGPGIAPIIAVGEEVGFVVNAKAAGKGKVTCIVVTPDGTEVEADVIQNEDGTFDIFYTAPTPGNYVIYVRFGGENVPKSPFRVMATDEAPMMQQQSANQQSAAPGAAGFQPWVQSRETPLILPFLPSFLPSSPGYRVEKHLYHHPSRSHPALQGDPSGPASGPLALPPSLWPCLPPSGPASLPP
uniref:Uncharacterized protein n=1 Tax=Hucho hucho TaxID=62062 RepID=A0A4W5KWV8_9TELE